MPLAAAFVFARLFVRLLLGVLLLSVGVSKLAHLRQFERGIQDYQLFPRLVRAKSSFSLALAAGIPVAELLVGLGLLSGFWLVPATLLAMLLFITFCVALSINLVRGRHDLSCHCGGVIGDHLISWWLVGRNLALVACLLILLLTPADQFTVCNSLKSGCWHCCCEVLGK
jgi:uncharacterized membrane protein YphA (DoxX/SURF4 family)